MILVNIPKDNCAFSTSHYEVSRHIYKSKYLKNEARYRRVGELQTLIFNRFQDRFEMRVSVQLKLWNERVSVQQKLWNKRVDSVQLKLWNQRVSVQLKFWNERVSVRC